ncbi:PLP-dependent aminotransferase family protein [Mesorhizobium sp. INR15]|uniref:MocR-like pyridoxine biosynthesis transcription factor PdxR n=1 Tax=Mesorhizobium sp. INR15 TaxID=2654248 RepID=UPI0018969CA9|nr:PLP-dependent aminotransferase family protein [Mesorhizobium sp. INR15]QPC91704.1 aminotransferase class I/II-fold pyridoxal phosphate-dependent enzyme [Mesorhizobium sp. INR15]
MTSADTRRREGTAHLVDIEVDRASHVPLARQLYLALREGIVAGRMPPGERLPSTRAASRLWGVSRGLVTEAYETLLSEGYAIGRVGSGTYVSTDVPERAARPGGAGWVAPEHGRLISRAARAVATPVPQLADPPLGIPFIMGRTPPDAKTRGVLTRIAHRHLGALSDHYRDPQGEEVLREAVAAYLLAARGVRCLPSQIFITAGSQQAIDLAIRTLIDPGDVVAVENPCYPPARLALTVHGARLAAVPVDGDGLDVTALAALAAAPRAIYVTPSHQYPTGTVLSMARRLALLDWAAATGAWVIEDDYDSEFRYDDRPLAALQGVDEHHCVIYAGTFSKALLPGLRLGYLVVPEDLVPAFRVMRALLDRFPAPFQQLVVADFLAEGHFSSHLRRLREAYRASRDVLVSLLHARLADHLRVDSPHQGVHLLARLGAGRNDVTLAKAARRHGVAVLPVSPMHVAPMPLHGFLFGFSGLTHAEADLGTAGLAAMFAAFKPG